MCDNAWDWARARGLLIKNPIHGAEEADIPYKTFWKKTDTTGNRVSFKSDFIMKVSFLPAMDCFTTSVSLCVFSHVVFVRVFVQVSLHLTEDEDGALLAPENEDLSLAGQGAASGSAGISDAEAAAQGGASFKLLGTEN